MTMTIPHAISRSHGRAAVEWPTAMLACVIFGSFGLLTWFHAALPGWLLVLCGGWTVAWYTSFQHEVIHGHPTRWRRINEALGLLPLALWVPYARYRETHLAHHRDHTLTDPFDDPESWYVDTGRWQAAPRWLKTLLQLNTTAAGRLTLGPLLTVALFLRAEIRDLRADVPGRRRIWLHHTGLAGVVLLWVVGVCGMPLWLYLVAFVYPGSALILLRSLAEHRAETEPGHRTAIVEGAPVLGLLFLFNNLHAVHHTRPRLPWYRIPAAYRRERESWIAGNGGLLYRGYGDVLRRYLLTPHHHPVHPFRDPAIQPSPRVAVSGSA